MRTVYKPAGLSVFPLHDDPGGDCVLARLLAAESARVGEPWRPGFEGGIAHRLDRSTSGAILVADDPGELERIREAFRGRALRKTYRFVAAKDVPWSENICEVRIAHDRRRKGRMVAERGASTPHRGRWHDARTRFQRVSGRLWQAEMRTGVMHQIRLHAAFVGIPLLGDRRYGGGPTPAGAPDGVDFFLHHLGLSGPGVATTPVARPAWTHSGWRPGQSSKSSGQ